MARAGMMLAALMLGAPLALALAYAGWRVMALQPVALEGRLVEAGDGACRMLWLGDSIVAQWPLVAPAGWRVARLGFSGAAAVNIEGPGRAAIARVRPQLLVIHAGTNDAAGAAFLAGNARARAEAAAAAAVARMAAAGRAGGAEVVVLGLVPPSRQPWWRGLLMGERQGAAMARIEALERLPDGVVRLDVGAVLAGPGGAMAAGMRTDHLHYGPRGYARLGAALAGARARACGG